MTDSKTKLTIPTCLCGGKNFKLVHEYRTAPEGEIKFTFNSKDSYFRQIYTCEACGHMQSVHRMPSEKIYGDEYVNSTYGDEQGLRKNFERITNLDPSKSDNVGRVKRINQFVETHPLTQKTLLDVGSGLGVFVHRMKETGWTCTALDPDRRAAAFAERHIGVRSVCADFFEAPELGKFDLVTFNKVIEHVPDPIRMLKKSLDYLAKDGVVYVEVPDGEMASQEGFGREEFFVEHPHIFSRESLAILAAKAGFVVEHLERLREPSSKYTLRAFLRAQ